MIKACEKCYQDICTHSVTAAVIWKQMIQLGGHLPLMRIAEEDPRLKTLEELGFILTTECDDWILIKLLGRKKGTPWKFLDGAWTQISSHDEETFCIQKYDITRPREKDHDQ